MRLRSVRAEDCPWRGCTINGTTGSDFLKGTSGNDVICGKGGNDILVDYKGGDDTHFGNGGKDIMLDVKGKGLLKGGDANDVLFTLDDAFLDTMNGQAANDICLGDKGDVRTNCERGSLISLSEEERKRLDAAKNAAGLSGKFLNLGRGSIRAPSFAHSRRGMGADLLAAVGASCLHSPK